jgi:hypothetical protein
MLDFPSAPTFAQKYPQPPVPGVPVYTWDGEKWTTSTSPVGGRIPIYADGTVPMSAQLTLVNPPVANTDAAAKAYVDSGLANAVQYNAQTPTSTQQAQARRNIGVMKKNYVVNGAMMVSQENGTNSTWAATTVVYAVDMFGSYSTYTSSVAAVQILGTISPAGSTARLRMVVGTLDATMDPGDEVLILIPVEGSRIADLKFGTPQAKQMTLQFGVNAPAGRYGVSFHNNAQDRHYVTELIVAAVEANIDTVKSITIQGDISGTWLKDSSGKGLEIRIALSMGSTYQTAAPNSWLAGPIMMSTANQYNFMQTVSPPNNVFELFDVGLYEGTVAPPFMVPDYASELRACQRYWQVLSSAQSNFKNFAMGFFISATNALYVGYYPGGKMRAVPTITFSSPAHFGGTAITVDVVDDETMRINNTIGGTAGNATNLQAGNTSAAKIICNARM